MSTDRTPPPENRTRKRGVPPLVWVVAAIFVAWAAVFFIQRDDEMVSPQGGTHPTSAQGDAVMPAAPATSAAPATPPSS
jgi:hypothetical protein